MAVVFTLPGVFSSTHPSLLAIQFASDYYVNVNLHWDSQHNTSAIPWDFQFWAGVETPAFSWVAKLERCDSGLFEDKKRDRFPTKSLVQGASKAASQLHEPLCAWASVQEFFSFFNSKLVTNTNTMINKTCKQITNKLWKWIAVS